MKTRNGFVSNSSSSSFMIDKYYLSDHQIEQIKDYKEVATKFNEAGIKEFDYIDDYWVIKETPGTIGGDTFMDNFDMHEFLKFIGVDMHKVEWIY
jgi:hypothetical protein